ncbi:MFS transporter [Cupriavidus taiwanensis]|uniref:MFS transporter n=1 Tax=Cupriavidus taiwanensis TaxID=164546 RepID=UPI000E20530D|nr:MFS transporter [Cupriavidus taiwanensis]
MFDVEAGLHNYKKKIGAKRAIEFVADINRHTKLFSPAQAGKGFEKPMLNWRRTLLDYNEHFIELSNMGEENRGTVFMLACVILFAVLMGIGGAAYISFEFSFDILTVVVWFAPLGAFLFGWAMWPHQIGPNFFTHLRARYRFNRTTRKVYVLRPDRYGGNVVLDWSRVQAHPNWCAPREMEPDEIDDKCARQRRQENAGGTLRICGLVLYWPPFDPSDPERKGEDVLWVGPKRSGENLWQYIRTFMEDGIDKVPVPNEYEWLRKGFHSPSQHVEETELGPSRALDDLGGRGKDSIQTQTLFVGSMIWAPLHCLAERLCKWPTFPTEWNSDCGMRRREDGIGPEEPLRWKPVANAGSSQKSEPVMS